MLSWCFRQSRLKDGHDVALCSTHEKCQKQISRERSLNQVYFLLCTACQSQLECVVNVKLLVFKSYRLSQTQLILQIWHWKGVEMNRFPEAFDNLTSTSDILQTMSFQGVYADKFFLYGGPLSQLLICHTIVQVVLRSYFASNFMFVRLTWDKYVYAYTIILNNSASTVSAAFIETA